MRIQTTPELQMLSESMARYLSDHCAGVPRHDAMSTRGDQDDRHWRNLAELGVLAALFEDKDGGLGGDPGAIVTVFERLGRHLVVDSFCDTLVAGRILAAHGDGERGALLAQIISGQRRIAFAHAEPGNHYEMAQVGMRASRDHNRWILDGRKTLVAQGCNADVLLVSARVHGAEDSLDGIALFRVPRGGAGVVLDSYPRVQGGTATEISLHAVEVPETAMVCDASQGGAAIEYGMGFGILASCSKALGDMEVIRDQTLEYLRTRRQFGSPLGKFQALRHRMADVQVAIESARSAVENAACALDQGRPRRERALSAAKYTLGVVATHVAEECIQMMGGIGMTWELPLSHHAKRLMLLDHQFGDSDHHIERYLSLKDVHA